LQQSKKLWPQRNERFGAFEDAALAVEREAREISRALPGQSQGQIL
jgi:hypothetical protein